MRFGNCTGMKEDTVFIRLFNDSSSYIILHMCVCVCVCKISQLNDRDLIPG
jgi:hypothetical protein